MEAPRKKFTQSLSFKGIAIAVLTLVLLIPNAMIMGLISERKGYSRATIDKINEKWSLAQTLSAPLLLVPYTITKIDTTISRTDTLFKPSYEERTLFITPKELKINASLTPEERYYGIYKAILYKSDIHFEGYFSGYSEPEIKNAKFHFDRAQIVIGISDLKGVTQNPDFKINGNALETAVGAIKNMPGQTLVASLRSMNLAGSLQPLHFEFAMKLNGSSSLNFIPVGQHTAVTLNGQWPSPSFI
ncbi:MAG: cell envelope integrity protein CreD, partial [Fibromonadales bacterium]|nr:cell envelope integrity protein CreD [Fibromonadales bacterium]